MGRCSNLERDLQCKTCLIQNQVKYDTFRIKLVEINHHHFYYQKLILFSFVRLNNVFITYVVRTHSTRAIYKMHSLSEQTKQI